MYIRTVTPVYKADLFHVIAKEGMGQRILLKSHLTGTDDVSLIKSSVKKTWSTPRTLMPLNGL